MGKDLNYELMNECGYKPASNQAPHIYKAEGFRKGTKAILSVCFVIIYLLVVALIIGSNSDMNVALMLILLVLAIVGGIATGVSLSRIKTDACVSIGADGIKVIKKGVVKKEYDVDGFEGSNVVKNYTNGIYTGTTRSIKLTNEKGKQTSLIWNYGADSFAEAVQDIQELKNFGGFIAKGAELNAINNSDDGAAEFSDKIFEMDREALGKGVINGGLTKFVGCAGILAVIAVIVILADRNTVLAIISAIMVLVALVLLGVGYALGKKAAETIPNSIKITGDAITVGEDTYSISSIQKMTLTPPNYEISYLKSYWLKIRSENQNKKYCLGRNKKNKMTYADYLSLTYTIRDWSLKRGVDYKDELG